MCMDDTSPAGQIYLTTTKGRGPGRDPGAATFIRSTGQYQLMYGSGPGFARVREGTNDMLNTPPFPQEPEKPSSKRKAPAATPLNFCIILSKDGRIDRQIDRPLEEYLAAIPTASIAWIDYSTKDDAREIEQLAQAAGFTKLPIPKALHRFLLGIRGLRHGTRDHAPLGHHQKRHHDGSPALCLNPGKLHITVHSEDINRLLRFSRYAQPFFKRISSMCTCDKITLMLERIIDENNDRNFEYPPGDRSARRCNQQVRSSRRTLRKKHRPQDLPDEAYPD